MSKYQWLYDYIDYFDMTNVEEVCRWEGGEKRDGYITAAYPVYDDKLLAFIEELYESDLLDKDYSNTLGKYGLAGENVRLLNTIDLANTELTKAILTFFIRGERFCDGLWSGAVRDKVFYRLLLRLRKLEGENK